MSNVHFWSQRSLERKHIKPIHMAKRPKTPKEMISPVEEKEEPLKTALRNMRLNQKDIEFILIKGVDFLDFPKALARRLNISIDLAKKVLDELKAHKNNKISVEDIKRFERLMKKNPDDSLMEIALGHGFDTSIVSAYLEYSETISLTKYQMSTIKKKIDSGFSIPEIADHLRISQIKVKEYVEVKFITFIGTEGLKILEIINKNYGEYPIVKLRELIISKNVDLQEQLCYKLQKNYEREYRDLRRYFLRFEESQTFFEIDETLSIKAKECIRASSLDNIEELSTQLNRMKIVISDYLLQYFPDESLMLLYVQEQLKVIKHFAGTFEIGGQISNTTYRMIITDSFDTLIQEAKKTVKRPKMTLKELLPLAFYYLKCSLPLEELSQLISNTTNMSLTTLDLFHIIFQMSDPIVRGLCIEHYSFSNPVPFYYPRLEPYSKIQTSCQFEICKELWYSLQQFNGLVSFGLGWASWNPIGKSHLLDLMFETDFVKGSPQNSAFHLGSIDIQMTKNLFGNKANNLKEPTQWAYFDCHGCSDNYATTKICQNMDISLIHVSYSDFEGNYPRLQQDLITMTLNTQYVYLLVRDHPRKAIKKENVSISGKKCTIVFIPHLNRNNHLLPGLKELGYTILHSKSRRMRLVDSIFLEDLIRPFDRRGHLMQEKALIVKIMEEICTEDREFSSLNFYPHFIEYMRCYYKASTETDQKLIDELNQRCVILNKNLNNVGMSQIVWYFNEILAHENSTLILWKLAQELRIRGGKYTLEVLWREALLSNKYNDCTHDDETKIFSEEFSSNFSNHVKRGEPFELIDGDNLRFFNQDIDALLSDLYENQFPSTTCTLMENMKNKRRLIKRPPIVISIFGPQSSGKSTLLNYCFGCKFLTSAGRCTKGVYGSLSKLSQPVNHSDHFLILDTEGLDSIERGNVLTETSCIEFDRTMVLFCLAVSQVVIINVRGEIGEELRNLLQICAYSLSKLKVSKVPTPKIYFVLNQQADPDPQKHLSSINILIEDLKRESDILETDGRTISDLIEVSRENLFVLPSAFNSGCVNSQLAKLFDSDLNKLSPTMSFANKCSDLRMAIIQQLRYDDTPDNQIQFKTMSEWMEMSGVIWDTIVKYQDIVKYRNVKELRCSIKLSKIVSDSLKNKIYSNKDEYRKITENLIKDIKNINSSIDLEEKIEIKTKDLDGIFRGYREEALEIFEELCQADPLLKKMNYMCDDAKINMFRLIYMEKKIYGDKIRLEYKARYIEIKLTEYMTKFQEAIEKNADKYLELKIEQQKSEFDRVWVKCFYSDNKAEEENEREEIFDGLYSVFMMESKTMENKQTIKSRFRDLDFEMKNIIETLRKEMLTKFCDDPNAFAGTEQFLYPWKENNVPLKHMTPYTGKDRCEYFTKDSLWMEVQNKLLDKKIKLKFQEWVPSNCYSLIKYCSGYFNHPDVIWNLEKRKQILLLASQLKDPNNLERSTWDKFISDIATRVEEFIDKDPNISHSTVKEIVDSLCYFCRVVNYEINYIAAKLTNTAERTISTFAFALAFKSLLETKTEKQRENKSKVNEKREKDQKYFLQKVDNRKMARGNWDRIEMRKGDQIIANKFAVDLLEALWREVNTTCIQNLSENYFNEKIGLLSHKSLLLLANEKIREELNKDFGNEPITEDNYVVQFICNQIQTMKKLFQEEWLKVVDELRDRIVEDMNEKFRNQISTVQLVLAELNDGLVAQCASLDRPEGIGLDSDSNFMVASESSTKESANMPNPKTREAPFKSMIIFLNMYLDPKVNPEDFQQFFNNTFEVDGVMMERNHDLYVLYENPTQVLSKELFKKLTDTKMFSCSETIFNLKIYIDEFLRTLNSCEFQVSTADYHNILKSTKDTFEANVINCPYQCPSCGKFCEREIHPHEGNCRIMTGHQLSSMGGKVWNTNKDRTAVLLMCEDYEDDTQVAIPGQNMKWWEFKEKCGDQWDWSLPEDENYVALQKENRQKMKNIWIKFGKEILQYYANKGTQIQYIPYTSPKEIYESLFLLKSYVCFVIDGTNLMRNSIKYVKHWVLELMRDLEGTSYFKVIVYHGNCLLRKFVEKFPNDSDFTSNGDSIKKFLENIDLYSDEENEFAMLHGLATATTGSKWESGFEVRNTIVHLYVEPTQGYFNIFKATGKCNKQSCSFDWEKDINNRMKLLNIEYKSEIMIPQSHPDHPGMSTRYIGYKIPSVDLSSEKQCKPKSQIYIDIKTEN